MYEVLDKDTIIFEIPPHLFVAKSGIILLIIKAVAFYVSVFLPDADVVLGAQNSSDGDATNTISSQMLDSTGVERRKGRENY